MTQPQASDVKPVPHIDYRAGMAMEPKECIVRVPGAVWNYVLHWGDGHAESGKPNKRHTHIYAAPGWYTLLVYREGDKEPNLMLPVLVRNQMNPPVTVASASGEDYTARVTFGDDPEILPDMLVSRYDVYWRPQHQEDPGDPPVPALGIPGNAADHYFQAGTHRVNVYDHASRRTLRTEVTITEPVHDPQFTLTEDTSITSRYGVLLKVTNSSGTGRQLDIYWGDGASHTIPADIGSTVSHEYDQSGEYVVEAIYTDNPDQSYADYVTVPFTDTAEAG